MNDDDNDWLEIPGDDCRWEQEDSSIYPLFDQDSQEAGVFFRHNTRDNRFNRRRPMHKFQRPPTHHGLRSQISQWHSAPPGLRQNDKDAVGPGLWTLTVPQPGDHPWLNSFPSDDT